MRILINIDVDDLDKAITFYTSAFGLHLARRLFGGMVAELAGASCTIQLLAKSPCSCATPAPASLRTYQRHWTPIHLDIEVDDLDVALERAIKAGARPEGQVLDQQWGRLATLSDPFGHGFCLLQLVGSGYDSVALP